MGQTDVMRAGVLGCGAVSHMYLPNLMQSPALEVVAVADVVAERAEAVAATFGVPESVAPDALVERQDLELLVNLTPIATHFEASSAALAAGKHVYSEKPLTVRLDDAVQLAEEAASRGLALGCAPDTLLGSGFQVGRAALRAGLIGTPLAATAVMVRAALGQSPYGLGTNPFFDMAPYYVGALVNLFGPVQRLTGATRAFDEGLLERGPEGRVSLMGGTLEFAQDVIAHLTVAWGSTHRSEVAEVMVYGTEGVLRMPNPNNFGDPARACPYGGEWREVPGSRQPKRLRHNLRGLGVADLARGVREGRPPRAGGDLAVHTVDVIAGLVASAEREQHLRPSTRCEPSAPLDPAERAALLGTAAA